MDKKKVIEIIQEVIKNNVDNLAFGDDKHNAPLRRANGLLHDALIELFKSDWISVEDELPPYGERVLVCDKGNPFDVYVSRREKASEGLITDTNGFAIIGVRVTHWHKIDKLEV